MEFGANFWPNELERVSNLFVGQRSISIIVGLFIRRVASES